MSSDVSARGLPPPLAADEAAEVSSRFSAAPPRELLAWAIARFGEYLAFANSFGAEDIVVLDQLLALAPNATVFCLDTGRLPEETHDLIAECEKRWGRTFELLAPEADSLTALLNHQGTNGFRQSLEARRACCGVRKVEPLKRFLATRAAWITGLRREQSITRADLPLVEIDHDHGGIAKLNPLANWSEDDVWRAVREHDLPINALHRRGYRSIGCAPCSRAVLPGEDVRAGRWWWEKVEQRECGLHLKDGRLVRAKDLGPQGSKSSP